MPSKRYFLMQTPFTHVNGKLSRVAVTCPNIEGGKTSDGFYYGFKRKASNRSQYGLRQVSRNLTTNPYTEGEINAKTLFKKSVQNANTALQDETKYTKIAQDYKKNGKKYATIFGYAMSECHKNNGNIPQKWTT